MNTTTAAAVAAPPVHRDMKILNRSAFTRRVDVSIASVLNPRDIQKIKAMITKTGELLSASTIKPVVEDTTDPKRKALLLQPQVKAVNPSTWSAHLSELSRQGLVEVKPYELTLTYDNYSMEDILDATMPEIAEDSFHQNPSGFAQIGHIAHLNLRDQFLPYKYLIGQVILDKTHSITTVMNKLHDVGTESVFRTFPYEIIAGKNDLNATVRHAECTFEFNFAQVYWNPRLSHEHERLVELFKPGEAVCDAMAGVGPFAVPAGKKKVWVRANDLNPASCIALQKAITINKVSEYVTASCMDGAKFIKTSTEDLVRSRRVSKHIPKVKISRSASPNRKTAVLEEQHKSAVIMTEPMTFDHFVMNLPASAIEFLWVFRGLYHGKEHLFEDKVLPFAHVYTFQAKKATEAEEAAELTERLSKHLGYDLSDSDGLHLHQARLVAPNKWFYCASFRLPASVIFAQPGTG